MRASNFFLFLKPSLLYDCDNAGEERSRRQNVGDTLTWVPISTNGHFFNCIPGTVTLVVTLPPPPIFGTEENTGGLKTIISAFPLDSSIEV